MIKVLHIGLSSNRGGIENVVYSWFKNKPEDVIFDFINVENADLAYQDEFLAEGKIYKIVARKNNPVEYSKELRAILENGCYNYIHCHVMALSNPEPTIYARRFSNTIPIIHAHTVIRKENLDIKGAILHRTGKWRLRNINYYRMACGYDAGEAMFDGRDFITIENGVDFTKLAYSEQDRIRIRNRYQIDEDAFVIGHVGRHGSIKNYPLLLKAFYRIHSKNIGAKLMLIGDVDKDETVLSYLRNLNLEGSVVFTGVVDCTEGFYAAMDAFCLPSLYEGVSVALIEAQAAGLKCVVSETVARESAISNNVEFVSIDDEKEVVEKLKHIMSESYPRTYVKLDPKYDVNTTSEKLFDFYRNHLVIN